LELVVLAIPLIVAAWVYSDAKSRGSSSPVLWAIGVFLLLIVFLPLYLMMRPPKATIISKQPMLCPHCGKYYEPPVKFCPNCGHELNQLVM